jgi:putative peptide zinc metalloprotease protein
MTLTPPVVRVDDVDPGQTLWVRAPGVDLLGEYQGSGWADTHYLVRRGDGQFAKLTAVLYAALEASDQPRTLSELSDALGPDIELDDVATMLRNQLAPVGMVIETSIDGDASGPVPMPTANPILALGLRGTIVPAGLVRWLARPLAHCFHPPVVALLALTWIAADVWLLLNGSAVAGLDQLIAQPLLALPLALLSLVIPLIHEFGHAAGCHYSGGRPGRIGFGVFIVWPALFTDVTDAYRLSRAARIRTDLGGLYFTVLGLLVVMAAYAYTGFEVLVLLLITLNVQAVQQLIPFVRTDGYYLLADVSGVPNPFSSIGPVLRSALPGREPDPQVAGMRPHTRRIITGWVLMVVPFLAVGLSITVWLLPQAAPRWVESVQTQISAAASAAQSGEPLAVAYAVLSLLVLMVPFVGGLIVSTRVVRALTRRIRGRLPAARHRLARRRTR